MSKLISKYPDKRIVFITPLHRISETKGGAKTVSAFRLCSYYKGSSGILFNTCFGFVFNKWDATEY